MLNKLKNLFKKKPTPEVKQEKPRKATKPKAPELSDKERATAAGEPYIDIVGMELNPKNINEGTIEFDWNDKFILNLIRAGYKRKDTDTDGDMVDRWWQTICRNTVLEIYEQEQADPEKRQRQRERGESFIRQYDRKDLGGGRSEIG